MPKLCVEYSKSGRAKCSLTSCGKKIEKNELRIGTEVVLPYSDDGVETWKWRHLCCFTERQLANARASNTLDDIQGEDELAPSDKALLQKMRDGLLVGDTAIIGRIGDVANSRLATELKGKGAAAAAKPKPKAKKADAEGGDGAQPAAAGAGAASPGEKRPRAPRKTKAAEKQDDDVDSEATDEYEVAVEAVPEKPQCPYGPDCFRTNPVHRRQYEHDSVGASSALGGMTTEVRPVIKRKK